MKRLAFSLTAALAVTAGADTLVHYHLNELESGTRATAATVFSNAANPGTLDGLPVTFNGGTKTDSNWLYPKGAEGLPSEWKWYDPVAQTRFAAQKAISVQPNNMGFNYNWGGGVCAEDVALTGDFSIEMFVRYADWNEGQSDAAANARALPLFCKETAQVGVEGHPTVKCSLDASDGSLKFSFSTTVNGVFSKEDENSYSFASKLNDKAWHHVACTYDSVAKTFCVYVDFALVKTLTLKTGATLEQGKGPLYLGLHPNKANACFSGSLAEFRLSDTVLTPASFIRAEKGDGSTLAWIAPGVAADPVPVYSQPDLSHSKYTLSDDIDGATLYDGAFDATGVAGRKSFAFSGESNAGGFAVTDETRTFAVNSFTAEIGFKFPQEAWKNFSEDCVYLFCQSSQWYVRCMRDNGRIDVCDSSFKTVATIPAAAWDDGAWHRLAVVSDRANAETRVYLDGKLMARAASVLGGADATSVEKIFVNCGCWGSYTAYSCKNGNLNDIRLTRKALKPSEFLMTKRVEGATLVWAPFDGKSDALVAAFVETPALSGAATLVGANAGELRDADGNRLREKNRGSLLLRTGAGAYSRLSLLERPDQTVEFFLRGSADAGTDLVSLKGVAKGQTNVVWALRQTSDGLKVVVADQEVASAGALSAAWSHFAIAFAPAADGANTSVTVYRDYAQVGTTGTFGGTLAVDGLADSALSFGAFAGNVDEVRVTRGTLAVADFLRAHRLGFAVIVR